MTFSKRFVLRGLVGLGLLAAIPGATKLRAQEAEAPAEQPAAPADLSVEYPFGAPAEPNGDEPLEAEEPATADELAQPDEPETADEPPKADEPAKPDPIRQALQTVTEIDATDMPLVDLVQSLKERHGIEIQLDTKALENAGVAPDQPVSISFRGLTLGASLRHVLRQKDLTWAVADGALVITTPEEAEQSYLDTRVYAVADLVAPQELTPDAASNAEALVDVIADAIAPDSWSEVGGPGAMWYRDGALSVIQTEDVHEQLAGLFAALREARGDSPVAMIAPPAANENARRVRQAIEEALTQPIELDLTDSPLTDVVAMLVRERQIPMLLDVKALEDAGIALDTPVTLAIRGVPLDSALGHLLKRHDLTWMVRDEALLITTQEEAEQNGLELRVYPVAGLLRMGSREQVRDSFEDLIDTVQQTVAADAWDEVGGPGSLKPEAGSRALVCMQTEQALRQVAKLLSDLQRARTAQPEAAQWASDDDERMELRVYSLELKQGDQSLGDADSVAMLIHDLVAPDSWQGNEGAYLRPLGNRLVVRQSRANQREIQRLLKKLDLLRPAGIMGE